MADRSVCEKCGKTLEAGEWPFCGGKNNHGFPLAGVSVIDDSLEGGARWCETMGHEPVWLDGSKSQWRREFAARGLINVDRHDAAYYARHRKQHDERLRDTGART